MIYAEASKQARLHPIVAKRNVAKSIVRKNATMKVSVALADEGNFKLRNGYYFITVDNKVFNVIN